MRTEFAFTLAPEHISTAVDYIRRRPVRAMPSGGPCALTIEQAGLRHNSPNWESTTKWSGLIRVDDAQGVVLLLTDDLYFYIVPDAAFESVEEKQAFLAHLREKAGAAAFAEAAATLSRRANLRQTMALFLGNLANGFRLALFLRVREDRLTVAWWQIAAFGLAGWLISVVSAVATMRLHPAMLLWAIPSAASQLPVFGLAAILAAYVIGRSDRTLTLLQAFLMINVAIQLAGSVAYGAVGSFLNHTALRLISDEYATIPQLWLAMACAKTTVCLFPSARRRASIAAALCAVMLGLPAMALYAERAFLLRTAEGEENGSTDYKGLDESVLYGQSGVLERELAGARPGRPGVIDVYYIGIGGYADQDVFMKEVDAVDRLFRERFDAEGKTIRLVNNRKTVATSPLASVTSLRASLKRVAEVMNRDEDILFLFLTSHGSKEHRLSLDFWPVKFHELDPATLRALLDDSGIRNRVVVVSACYSGGFIGPLKDQNTLVISASAADRNSFGCSNEAEWTYFGKAYFDEALRQTHSFVEAFEIAKPAVAEREKKSGYKPSEPQIAVGEAIKPKLSTLEQQLGALAKGYK